jgi:nitroreductase
MTSVSDAVAARFSCRAFLPDPVPRETVEEMLTLAARAPSGGNLQPWQVDVLAGGELAALKQVAMARLAADPRGEGTEFPIYPEPLEAPWRERRSSTGASLYAALGIARDDGPARLAQFARNYDLFGAPVGLFFSIDRSFGPPQWAHVGMFMQNVMLLAYERGLATCAQESWAAMHRTAAAFLGLPEGRMLYCAMALGRADPDHPANGWRTDRAPLESFAALRGF